MTMRFSPLAGYVAHGEGDPWALHWRAQQALAAGRDVILLSVGDPDLDTPVPVVDAAVAAMRGGDTSRSLVSAPAAPLTRRTRAGQGEGGRRGRRKAPHGRAG